MRRARRAFVAPLTAVVLFFAASSADAGSITITYDLTSSVVSLLGGALSIPPGGTITSATAQVTVQGSSATNATAGAAQITNLTLVATINGTVGGSVLLTGGFSGSQVGGGAGTLTGALANIALSTLSLNLNGNVNCIGGLCPALGSFPVSLVNSLSILTGIGNIGVGGFGTLGAGTLNGLLTLSIGGSPSVVSLSGQEINRTYVPEPNSFALLGLGVVGLAGFQGRRARRH